MLKFNEKMKMRIMRMTKNEWKALDDRLVRMIKNEVGAVAVKFVRTQEQNDR